MFSSGNYSQNFPQVHDLAGQAPNHNMFLLNMSNIIGPGETNDPNIAAAFRATIPLLPGGPLDRPVAQVGFMGNLGQYEQSSIHSDGSLVQGPIIAPWEAVFVPNPALAIPADSKNDFRVDVNNAVKPGDVIYTVMARRNENSTEYEHVGEIVADSEFIASEYGDGPLFFRHPSLQWRP